MKKTFASVSLLLALALSLVLASCGGAQYKNDVALSSISYTILSAQGENIEYYEADENYLEFVLELDASNADEVLVYTSDGLEQYGIFKTSADKKAALKASLEKYLAAKAADELNLSYFPGEEGKVKNASVLEYGDYLVYLFVADEKRPEIESAIKTLLTK